MASRATRKQIEREFLCSVIREIEHLACDPWPDHLWPQANEVCGILCRRLSERDRDSNLVASFEGRACEEGGLILWQLHEGKSPIHRAYTSLFDLYCEVESENERLRKMLGLEHNHMSPEYSDV